MTMNFLLLICEIAIIASAVVSGVFLTFSDFVMKSLAATNPAGGIETMQIINRKVFATVFMVLLIGMSALSPALGTYAYLYLNGVASIWIVAGSGLFFVGAFGVSLIFNVPMNQRLDKMDHSSTEAATYWTNTYVPSWSFWNYVRAITSAGSAICFLVASLLLSQGV